MIIAIWGNNGCGSSTLAAKLALQFSNTNKNVVLVDSNFVVPQAKIWFPKNEFAAENSMSVILSNNVEMDNVANKITMINDYLGVLGYANELSINSIPNREDTPGELLSVLNTLADVVIVDCQSNITQDVMSFMALDIADTKIINFTPDIRGLSWYNSNVMMLKDKWMSQNVQIINILNSVKPHSPIDAIEKAVGTVDFVLPYGEEIAEEIYTGKIGQSNYKGHARKYGLIVESLSETIDEFSKTASNSGIIIEKDPIDNSSPNNDIL